MESRSLFFALSLKNSAYPIVKAVQSSLRIRSISDLCLGGPQKPHVIIFDPDCLFTTKLLLAYAA